MKYHVLQMAVKAVKNLKLQVEYHHYSIGRPNRLSPGDKCVCPSRRLVAAIRDELGVSKAVEGVLLAPV